MAVHTGFREGSFDCLLHSLMQKKRNLAESALWPMGDTSTDADQLQRMLSSSVSQLGASGDPLKEAVEAMFNRDGLPMPPWDVDGSVPLDSGREAATKSS